MKTVLIADDDHDVLKPICAYLTHRNAELKTVPARSGSECIEILENQPIDLVLSDLRMPDGDGIDVLAYLSRNNPSIPVIVMSGFVISQAAEDLVKFGNLRFLSKPAGMDEIHKAIEGALREPVEIGSFNGFSLAGILQLLEMEEKTCLLEVAQDESRRGFFALVRGRMVRAACGDITGEDAALEILTWTNPRVRVRLLPHSEKMEPEVNCNLTELLMRSFKNLDESQVGGTAGGSHVAPSASLAQPAMGRADSDAGDMAGFDIFSPAGGGAGDAGDEKKSRRFKPFERKSKKPPKDMPPLHLQEGVKLAPRSTEVDPADSGVPTSVAYDHKVKIEHPSPWLGVAVFLALTGVMVGYQAQAARFADFQTYYLWGRNILVLGTFLLVFADAYQSGIGLAALCVLFPPYAVVYAVTRLTSYPQRGLCLAAVVILAAEVFLLPDQAVILSLMQGASEFIEQVDRLILRAGA